MRLQQQVRIVDALGELIQLLHDLARGLALHPPAIKPVQAEKRTEELRRIFDLSTEDPRPRIGALDLWGRLPMDSVVGERQGELQVQFVMDTLAGLWQGAEHLQAPGHVADRFEVRGALERPLPGLLPVWQRLLPEARFRVVMGYQLRLGLGRLGKALR